jgi:hypothetical protein
VEKGILSIRYNIKELRWIKRDDKGVGIESWSITLPLDDIARDLIRDQIIQRKDRFLKALTNNAVECLPRLQGEAKTIECKRCPFKAKCFDEDLETLDASNWDLEQERDNSLKMSGIVNLMDGNE